MEKKKMTRKGTVSSFTPLNKDFFARLREESWAYIKTVVDVVREPVLILDKNFRVLAANEPFYRAFHVKEKDTENLIVYELGNGQWNIPALRKLLETILPKNTFFRGFTVSHTFPSIGKKTMILNARQIFFKKDSPLADLPPIILLAMEDITEMMSVADRVAKHSKKLEDRLDTLEATMGTLQNDMASIGRNTKRSS